MSDVRPQMEDCGLTSTAMLSSLARFAGAMASELYGQSYDDVLQSNILGT